jgi:Rifampin ADP-ribosyl transferase
VEPTGPFEDDPNLTNQRFPGNPTTSYRTREPLRVVEEIADWTPHAPEVVDQMREHLAELKRRGVEAINDCTVMPSAGRRRRQRSSQPWAMSTKRE